MVVENSLFANNTFMTVHLDDGKFISKNNTFVMDPLAPTFFIQAQGKIHLIIADCYMFSHGLQDIPVVEFWVSSVVSISNTYISYGTGILFNFRHISVFKAQDSSFVGNASGNTTVLKANQLQAQLSSCVIFSGDVILDVDLMKPSAITLDNCTIMNSTVSTSSVGMFHLMEGNLSMTNTTISNIKQKEGVFLYAGSNSAVFFTNSRYENNIFNQHFHITGGSTLNITGSEFIYNRKPDWKSLELIYSNNTKISIKSSNFLHNSVGLDVAYSSIILEEFKSVGHSVDIALSNITLKDCQFENTILYLSNPTPSSVYTNYNTFVQMMECTFVEGRSKPYIFFKDITKVFVQNCLFQGKGGDGFKLFAARDVMLANVTISNTSVIIVPSRIHSYGQYFQLRQFSIFRCFAILKNIYLFLQ